ncbi:hypothetical protein DNTS_026747 [Danionella cerebrum]|uniref:Uncharacterized protein n=1 Tax=Danionella cerebrum TaxID=2873325 RepID=A0A553RP45_9TELE|nr:hypothetical protein DNTS_026747 [Danionella translucida]
MSRFRRYKYATSLPTWSPFVPRPPPPRSPSSKVNDCHESSRGHTVKAPIPRHVPTGFGGTNQQQLSSRQRLPPLLKPLAAKEDVRSRIQETFNSNCSHQSAEEYLSNHHLSLEIPASTYLLILDIFGESVAWSERPKVQLLTFSCPSTLGCSWHGSDFWHLCSWMCIIIGILPHSRSTVPILGKGKLPCLLTYLKLCTTSPDIAVRAV